MTFIGVFITILIAPTITITKFYLNQDSIIAEKCVNKDKPELNCNGHCYLKKELNSYKNIESDKEQSELQVFIFSPSFVQKIADLTLDIKFSFLQNHNFTYKNYYSFLYSNHLLDPPKI